MADKYQYLVTLDAKGKIISNETIGIVEHDLLVLILESWLNNSAPETKSANRNCRRVARLLRKIDGENIVTRRWIKPQKPKLPVEFENPEKGDEG